MYNKFDQINQSTGFSIKKILDFSSIENVNTSPFFYSMTYNENVRIHGMIVQTHKRHRRQTHQYLPSPHGWLILFPQSVYKIKFQYHRWVKPEEKK